MALNLLRETLALAEPEGYVRLFVDEGPAMRELLQLVATHQASESYASRLLRALGDVEPSHTHVVVKTPMPLNNLDSSMMVEALSEHETDILRHLATGMSSHEIAEALSIAVSTVRWHTKNVYGKLGVRNRTEAALMAGRRGYRCSCALE